MEKRLKKRDVSRSRRVLRVRKNLKGTLAKPRLSVCKTNKHMYAQLIDDENGHTLASATSLSKEEKERKSKEVAKKIGLKLAQIAKEKNINKIVFDRGRFKYHGLIAHLADAAREGGLEF